MTASTAPEAVSTTSDATADRRRVSTGAVGENRPRLSLRRRRARRRYLIKSVALWLLAVLFILPFVWMLSSSLKQNLAVFAIPMQWLPHPVEWLNYAEVWLNGSPSMAVFFSNSITVSLLGVVGDLTTSAMAGYAFARLSFAGRDKVFLLYLATAIVPNQLLLVPRFMFFQQVGLYNTLWALILPGIFTVFGTFLMRQTFLSLPAEYGEAARIDGAGEWRVFTRVYLPQAKATLAALGIISFVGSWNDYESPLIMLSDKELFTVPLGLTRFVDADGGLSAGYAMAGSVSSVIPIMIIFLLFQRHFIAALASSGLK
ncbi:carbohydrate ABC transporter permease [Microlunatus soli]|uniref:Carbohydrate ABC transporter membrane protein 2, CUT1 family n=1 Tax=Microlunatus soli TaxID=630515 RepID=A0A1H1YKJ9_9ACTN|nr:carbohydrate ABC transporter permease [Microlunatus soli]SDT21855.1 carbohydrate ABC transporter membrane protein 2, CUT1 family [Microlunatus soli]